MAFALIADRFDQSGTGNGYTSGSINSTGANFLCAVVTDNSSSSAVVTDSYGNTWVKRTPAAFGGTDAIAIWDVTNPTVGAGHTISVSGTTNYPSSHFSAWSGADTTAPFDVENGAAGLFPPMSPGSVTPSVANEIVITGMRNPDGSSTIDLSFTILGQVTAVGGLNTGLAVAYLIQTGATAVAPTWQTGNFGNAAVIAAYKSGGAPPAGGGLLLPQMSQPINTLLRM